MGRRPKRSESARASRPLATRLAAGVRRLARGRASRVAARNRGGSPRRSRAPTRSGRAAGGASRGGRCRLAHRGSVRTRPPRRAAAGDRASAVPTRSLTGSRRGARREPLGAEGDRTLRRNTRTPSGSRPATAPRAPVSSRENEVPVRGARLLVGGRSVTEEAPFVRPHLEEAEVLAVPCGRLEARLAPRDVERLVAVPAEHRADRLPRRQRGHSLGFAPGERLAELGRCACRADELPLGAAESQSRLGAMASRAEERGALLVEADRAAVTADRVQLGREAGLEGDGRPALRSRRPRGRRRLSRLRGCRASAEDGDRAQADDEGSQGSTSWSGTGARRRNGRRSCRSIAAGYTKRHEKRCKPLQNAHMLRYERRLSRERCAGASGRRAVLSTNGGNGGWQSSDRRDARRSLPAAATVQRAQALRRMRPRGCGAGIRTPTSWSRARRPTVRRPRNGRPECRRVSLSSLSYRRCRGGTRARGASRPRCRSAQRPRRRARGPIRAASPSAGRRPGRSPTSCS
jgi:hypothetical protein